MIATKTLYIVTVFGGADLRLASFELNLTHQQFNGVTMLVDELTELHQDPAIEFVPKITVTPKSTGTYSVDETELGLG